MHRDLYTELHVFSDASKEAYGAAIYARTERSDGEIMSRLVVAKTRVSPLKAISIAKLELCGAVVGTRLVERTSHILESGDYNRQLKVIYWTDSMNVLYWISRPGKHFKPYVANRVGEIQERTSADQWRHVPSKLKPTDLSSRGLTVEELAESTMWWEGPDYLKKNEEEWPKTKLSPPEDSTLEEV
jgi:hypothetical protein